MKQGYVKISSKLIEQRLGLKPGVEINGIEYNPFDRTIEIIFTGEQFPEQKEAAEPYKVMDPEEIFLPVEYKQEEPRPGKTGIRISIGKKAYAVMQPIEPPPGYKVEEVKETGEFMDMKITRRWGLPIGMDRERVLNNLHSWAKDIVAEAQRIIDAEVK